MHIKSDVVSGRADERSSNMNVNVNPNVYV